jgi:hypothetical protein
VASWATAVANRPRADAGPTDIDARDAPPRVRRPQGGLALLGLADEEEISGEIVAAAAGEVADEPSGEVFAEAEPLVEGAVADEQVADELVGDEPVDGDLVANELVADEDVADELVGDELVGDGLVADELVADEEVGYEQVGDEQREDARSIRPGDQLADEPTAGPAHARVVEPAHAARDEHAGELAAERVDRFAAERVERFAAERVEKFADEGDADLAAEVAADRPIPEEEAAEPVGGVAGGNRFVDEHEDGSGEVARFGTVASQTAGVAPRVDRYGDRIDGWIRPHYREQYEPGGEYWTPVPESSYADAGYGWPVPVERLPPVPSYPPHSGFDPEPVDEPEPTAVVPQWPPAKPSERTDPLRSWTARNTKAPRAEAALDWIARDRAPAVRDEAALDWVARDRDPDGRSRRGAVMIDRRPPGGSADTELLPAVNETAPRRRPRPRPSQPDQQSTVYRSRHAADPG